LALLQCTRCGSTTTSAYAPIAWRTQFSTPTPNGVAGTTDGCTVALTTINARRKRAAIGCRYNDATTSIQNAADRAVDTQPWLHTVAEHLTSFGRHLART